MTLKPFVVLTTINAPNQTTRALKKRFTAAGTIVIGDLKTPTSSWRKSGVQFVSLAAQRQLAYDSVSKLPANCYARKNVGYLMAMEQGASAIYDTDDDNRPNGYWALRNQDCVSRVVHQPGWCNVYHYFQSKPYKTPRLWPRGFPLTHLASPVPKPDSQLRHVDAPIQQGLAAGSADVDAVWRLVFPKSPAVQFDKPGCITLAPGVWCPFNSQTTWWWPEVFPLLYLPVHCSFRMTDIWRSFVAQRCLWATGKGITFCGPAEVHQARNPHNLLKDFQDEVPGYLNNSRIATTLERLDLPKKNNVFQNLYACYEALCWAGFFPDTELNSVLCWTADVIRYQKAPTSVLWKP